MASGRLAVSLLLLVLLVGGAGAFAYFSQRGGPGAAGAHEVVLVGPEGILFEGAVHVDEATALSVLEAAAAQAGLALEKEEYPGMGTYVRSIGGHRADGPTGWIYDVRRGDAWEHGDRSAERYALEPGDAVRWSWTSL